MALAKTGFVLLCTVPSKMFPPSGNNLIEMLKNDLAHLAPQTRCAIEFKLLGDVEELRIS